MIKAAIARSSQGLAARLTDKARRLARARAEQVALRRNRDGAHWRSPNALWPLFTEER